MNSETEILVALESTEPSFRLSAIERAGQEGATEKLLTALEARKNKESEPEFALLISHAISEVKRRLGKLTPEAPSQGVFEIDGFLKKFAAADPARRLDLLSALRPNQITALKNHAPDLLTRETHSLVGASIIKAFGSQWPQEHFRLLSQNLGSKNLSLRLAALEVLVQSVPQELSVSLPKLLVSPDPRIRQLAIRGLAGIDLEEALVHHEYLLSSGNVNDRLAAIENSVHFPFERIKTMLFRFMAAEKDSIALMKAGVLFAINPDIEVPYRLWEMVEISAPEKAVILKSISNEACQALEKSGRLKGKDYKRYLEQLSEWVQQRFATRLVQDSVSRMAMEDGKQNELETVISRNLDQPYVRKAFETALQWPLHDKVKTRLRDILKKNSSGQLAAEEGPTPGEADKGGPDTKIRQMAMLKNSDRQAAREIVSAVLASEHSPTSLLSTALRTAIRLEIADYSEQAAELIKSSDPALVAPAIDYLNQFHFEKVYPFLKKFVRSADVRVKAAAVKALKKDDIREALATLHQMLFSGSLEEQNSALASMVHFDFSTIRDMLIDFLSIPPNADSFNNALCLFSANPEPENSYRLYKLARSLPKALGGKVDEVRAQTEAFLVGNGMVTAEESKTREAGYPQKLAQEREKLKDAPAPYSLRALKGFFDTSDDSLAGSFSRGGPARWALVSGVALLLLFVIFAVAGKFSGSNKDSDSQKVKNAPRVLEGKIIGKDSGSGGLLFQTGDRTILVLPGAGGASELARFSSGDRVKGEVIPVGMASNGMQITRFDYFEKN